MTTLKVRAAPLRRTTAKISGKSLRRIIEVFPPYEGGTLPRLGLQRSGSVEAFVSGVRRIRDFADLVLVADLKDPSLLKMSSVHAAALLMRDAGVDAMPVIVARDSNRPAVMSQIYTAFKLGMNSIMLTWGDRYPDGANAANVYDFPGLAQVIGDTRRVARVVGISATVYAPVDVSELGSRAGAERARARVAAGADLLLAQPPTTDAGPSLIALQRLLESSRLTGRVMPGVFPFRNEADVIQTEEKFGWKLPGRLHRLAESGRHGLLQEERRLAAALESRSFPGVYVSTRGHPEVVKAILG